MIQPRFVVRTSGLLFLLSPGLAFGQNTAAIPTLDAPMTASQVLFEQPILGAGVCAGIGVIAFVILNRSGRAKQGLVALAIGVVLAIGAWAAGAFVTTARETIVSHTRELASATATADLPVLERLLAEKTVASNAHPPYRWSGKASVLGAIDRYLGPDSVRSHTVRSIDATMDGPGLARSLARVSVRAEQSLYDVPISAWLMLQWQTDGDGGWLVTGIDCLRIDGIGGN